MSGIARRQFVLAGAAAATVAGTAGLGAAPAEAATGGQQFRPPAGPRFRVISDNDYSGDPDGLYQLAQLLLSPSVEVRAVIGSHLAPNDPFDPSTEQARNAYRRAVEVLRLLGLSRTVRAYASNRGSPVASPPCGSAARSTPTWRPHHRVPAGSSTT